MFGIKQNEVIVTYGLDKRLVLKEDLKRFLERSSTRNAYSKGHYNASDKCIYKDVYHFMMMHLEEVNHIMFYNDGAIRMGIYNNHFWPEHAWDTPEAYKHPENFEMVKSFVTFVYEYNKKGGMNQ